MNKTNLTVPDGIKYLSDWQELWTLLPLNQHYILNKRICGCGATEAYIRSDKKVILASPRKHLLYNKFSQHLSDNLHLYRYLGDKKKYFESKTYTDKDKEVFEGNLTKYISTGGTKILTTYDSLKMIWKILAKSDENLEDWIVVVDEFQAMFSDCQYKPEIELEFYQILQNFSTVVYLSATPFLETYLDMMKLFKNLTIYELLWQESMTQLPNVEVIKSKKSVLELSGKLIKAYRENNGRSKIVDGEKFVSREAVFYINSVSEIKKIINKHSLKPSEVNIICSSVSENIKKIDELSRETGEKFKIGDIPGKGETHKMFTFCTSTVYIGADFYSTNAYSYIFANPQVSCMTVDVSVDLQQIIGRQRLAENPFRNSATLYFNTKRSVVEKAEIEKTINEKNENTERQIENYNAVPNKTEQVKLIEKAVKSKGHKDHYCCIVKKADGTEEVVKNEILEIADRRAWEVSNLIYKNDFSMYRALKTGVNVTKASDSDNEEVRRIFSEWDKDNQFSRKAKLYCDLYDEMPELLGECSFIEWKFKEYHDALGREGFKALCWREDYIRQALSPTPFDKIPKNEIAQRLIIELNENKDYKRSDVKNILQGIYKDLGIQGKPSASDISSYMMCEEKTLRLDGKKTAMLKIKSHARKKVSLFAKITDVKNPQEYDIDKLLDIIRDDTYFHLKTKVEAVRNAKTKEEKARRKAALPVVTWNGIFRSKNKNECVLYSSFTALDFDNIEPERMPEFAKWLEGFSCVYAYFITPSGNGYKAIMMHDNYDPLYHYDLYRQLLEHFKCPTSDSSTCDLARGNYLSYDPGVWRNPSPEPYHFIPSTPEPEIPEIPTKTVIKDKSGEVMIIEDDVAITKFLNRLSQQVISDDSIIRILRKTWNGKSLANGRNNTAMSYAGVLCKAGVEKARAKEFIEELIPDFDITEIIEYAYTHNIFGCERRRYRSKKG